MDSNQTSTPFPKLAMAANGSDFRVRAGGAGTVLPEPGETSALELDGGDERGASDGKGEPVASGGKAEPVAGRVEEGDAED